MVLPFKSSSDLTPAPGLEMNHSPMAPAILAITRVSAPSMAELMAIPVSGHREFCAPGIQDGDRLSHGTGCSDLYRQPVLGKDAFAQGRLGRSVICQPQRRGYPDRRQRLRPHREASDSHGRSRADTSKNRPARQS